MENSHNEPYSLNEGLSTIQRHARHIVEDCGRLPGGALNACILRVKRIAEIAERLQPALTETEESGGEVGRRFEDDDGVGRSREDVRVLRDEAEAIVQRELHRRTHRPPRRRSRKASKKGPVRGRGRSS